MAIIILTAVALGTFAVMLYLLFKFMTRYTVPHKLLSANSVNGLWAKVKCYEEHGYVCITEPFAINVGGKNVYYQQVHHKDALMAELVGTFL